MYITISHPSYSNPNISTHLPPHVIDKYCLVMQFMIAIHLLSKRVSFKYLTPLLKTIRWGIVPLHRKVQIIASQFSYCNCKVYVIQGMWISFFHKKNFIYPHIFPHYIHILFIHCILLKEILLIPKITSQSVKDALHFLQKKFYLRQAKSLEYAWHIYCEVNFKW